MSVSSQNRLALPDFLEIDLGAACAASRKRGSLRHLEDKENMEPNAMERVMRNKRGARRAKKAAAAPSNSAAAPSAAAAQPQTRGSPYAAKAHGDSRAARKTILQRCPGLAEAEAGSSNVSPPLGRVMERHRGFAEHARAAQARGPSALAAGTTAAGRGDGGEVDCLACRVSRCELHA